MIALLAGSVDHTRRKQHDQSASDLPGAIFFARQQPHDR
jgi:hypothetical protein